jgi:PBP1b-binding outer membrane lipoprotein LpoB
MSPLPTPFFRVAAWLLAAAILAGCETSPPPGAILSAPPVSPVAVVDGPRMASFDIDARDYNQIARGLHDSLVKSGRVPRGAVVALGPVIYRLEPAITFDHRTLGEKIQVEAMRSGLLQFQFAIDAQTKSDRADSQAVVDERMKIMQLRYEQSSAVEPEDLVTFGRLAKIDALLFGRVSTRTAAVGGYRETTYTFNWKLGECQSGLLVWTDEFEFTKRTR